MFAEQYKSDYQPKCIRFVWNFGWWQKKFAKQILLVSNFCLHKQLCEIDLGT